MTIFWKRAAMLGLAIAGLGVAAVPAEAQYHGGHGYRDGYRGDRDGRWEGRRHWRGKRSDWRHSRSGYHRASRQRCWTEWRYDRYRDRSVRVRICR